MTNTTESNPPSNPEQQPHPCEVCGKKIFYLQVHGTTPEDVDPNLLRCEDCNAVLRYLSASFGLFE